MPKKPRLVFVEEDIPGDEFATDISAVIPFTRSPGWFDENEETIRDQVASLVAQAQHNAQPSAMLRGPAGGREFDFVSASRLYAWLQESSLRFVYLGSCRGAAPGEPAGEGSIRRFDNLVQAVVRAGVPETVGFLWPVDDKTAMEFALSFYERFFRSLRSAHSLRDARRAFGEHCRIWAAPVLYSQVGTGQI